MNTFVRLLGVDMLQAVVKCATRTDLPRSDLNERLIYEPSEPHTWTHSPPHTLDIANSCGGVDVSRLPKFLGGGGDDDLASSCAFY